MINLKKRYFLLVEVLIAFVIVIAALLPILHPHFYIYQQQAQFVHKIDLDIAINNLYATILQKLQTNEIGWGTIESGQEMVINDQIWSSVMPGIKIPFIGSYKFAIESSKKNEEYGVYLLNLLIKVAPKENTKKQNASAKKMLSFNFTVFATRVFKKGEGTSTDE